MEDVADGRQEVGGLGEGLAGADHGENAVQVAPADEGKEVEVEGEHDQEQDPEPEDRHGQAQEREDPQRVIDQRVPALERRDDADRDADEGGHDGAGPDQHQGVREHAGDVLADRIPLAEGVAEVKAHRPPDVVGVLDRERAAEPEVLRAVRERLRGCLVAHHGHARVPGQDAHREEHDAHRPEQHRAPRSGQPRSTYWTMAASPAVLSRSALSCRTLSISG